MTKSMGGLLASLLATVVGGGVMQSARAADWTDKAISPVANPIYFEDARITTEVRPIFIEHYLPSTYKFQGGSAPLGGDVQVYALQLRYALNDRLALIATKDGYIAMHPQNTLGHTYGWANLAAGLKYALVDDRDKQLLVTPGFTVELPTGNPDVFQHRGDGEWNLFVSSEKGWDNLHLQGNAGLRLPNNFSQQTAQAHYSAQLDYYVCQYFIPFFVANGSTVLSKANNQLLPGVNMTSEMSDLINFGATDARGATQVTLGGGARAKVTKSVDVGVAYEVGVTHPAGIFDSRITADLIWRF
jgi:hypothetical protein